MVCLCLVLPQTHLFSTPSFPSPDTLHRAAVLVRWLDQLSSQNLHLDTHLLTLECCISNTIFSLFIYRHRHGSRRSVHPPLRPQAQHGLDGNAAHRGAHGHGAASAAQGAF